MRHSLSLQTIVVVTRDQVSCDLAGEAAVLQMSPGVYYGLNEVGTRVWNLIQQPRSVEEVCGILLEEFDVEAERCYRDTLVLLEDLLKHGLIEARRELAA